MMRSGEFCGLSFAWACLMRRHRPIVRRASSPLGRRRIALLLVKRFGNPWSCSKTMVSFRYVRTQPFLSLATVPTASPCNPEAGR